MFMLLACSYKIQFCCQFWLGKMAPEPKRRKIEPPPLRRTVSSPAAKKTRDATSVPAPQTHRIDYRIQQAKNFAVAQAQQEGCTGNFRIFDSPFGNFLVPVIPTREELAE
ncbi:hypothetical protein P3X46_007698 [Hevea brasiliensis]|uniref:Uncharacterized protein n=1 Tax=Hevea brasiliensis TaxID=3981 RepID=A0ABQ9MUB6_HEVBR|nr:uncharacterized protein LOC110649805 isoform X3 [Hevea brasiliensis]KAJ9183899.1 hypothetical protein P3X46_007698 [Hevea brasiliensis]